MTMQRPIYHKGELTYVAFHPDKTSHTFKVIKSQLLHWAKLGEWWLNDVQISAAEVLQNPGAIYEGLRKEEDENRGPNGNGWWCYAGIPSTRFLPYGAGVRKPHDREVLLVFVSEEDVVYSIRWEPVENHVAWIRGVHPSRFKRQVYLSPNFKVENNDR